MEKFLSRKAKCAVSFACEVLSYNGGVTSNLLQHLSSKHPSTIQAHKDDSSTENAMAK